MRKTLTLFYAILTLALLFGGQVVMAQGGIVPCGPGVTGNESCDKEDFFVLVHNVMKYAIILSTMAVSISIAYAAVMYLISQGEMEKLNKAKGAIKAAIIGLVIVSVGWLLVNTVLSIFGCSNWNVFNTSTVSTVCTGI